MRLFTLIGRVVLRLALAVRGRRQIRNIPVSLFDHLVHTLQKDGWITLNEYHDFDAWTEYGLIDLEKDGRKLHCELTQDTDGRLSGQTDLLKNIAGQFGLCDPGGGHGTWL